MSSQASKSTFHAKKSLILGHIHSGMGEKTQCLKLKRLLNCPVFDIFELFQDFYEPLAQTNYALAENGHPILEDIALPIADKIRKQLPPAEILFLLSWNFSAAAAFALGVHKNRSFIAKLYAHHKNEKILPALYEPAEFLITESLLAVERALAYGIKEEKILHLPHYYPELCDTMSQNRLYVEILAKKLGKNIRKETQVIGTVARLEYGKNCEFALEAVRQLALKGKDVVLVLKGNFSAESQNRGYQERLSKMLETYIEEPWLLWDKENTTFPDVLHQYSSFDLLLHPSGAEAGSNVIVECLGLQKPVIALNCSTNPYLFKGLVTFVKTTETIIAGQLPFYIPDLDDLVSKLEAPLFYPDMREVQKRFHVENTRTRLNLLFEKKHDQIKRIYEEDRKLFQI